MLKIFYNYMCQIGSSEANAAEANAFPNFGYASEAYYKWMLNTESNPG